MKLNKWRKEKSLSYEDLARLLGMTNSKTYRLCTDKNLCIKLQDAHVIVQKTSGEIGFEDLLLGDC